MAHGVEICLLRDLYRARTDARDALVAAALRGDAAEVTRLLDGGATPRPSLTAEAAGLRHWEVVRVLAERGADVNTPTPALCTSRRRTGRRGRPSRCGPGVPTRRSPTRRTASPPRAGPSSSATPNWRRACGREPRTARPGGAARQPVTRRP